jgi:hypothetical protein
MVRTKFATNLICSEQLRLTVKEGALLQSGRLLDMQEEDGIFDSKLISDGGRPTNESEHSPESDSARAKVNCLRKVSQ